MLPFAVLLPSTLHLVHALFIASGLRNHMHTLMLSGLALRCSLGVFGWMHLCVIWSCLEGCGMVPYG